jgi:hypothetical protein
MAPLRPLPLLPPSEGQRPLQLVAVVALGAGLSFTLLSPAALQEPSSPHHGAVSAEDWQTHVRFNQMDSTP